MIGESLPDVIDQPQTERSPNDESMISMQEAAHMSEYPIFGDYTLDKVSYSSLR